MLHRLASLSLRVQRSLVAVAAGGLLLATHRELAAAPAAYASRFGPGHQGPRAPRRPHAIDIHGDLRVDFYYWLRDDEREDSEMLALCNAENDHVKKAMSGTDELQSTLFSEMRSRIKEDDVAAPVRKDGYYYYQRWLTGKQYAVNCRRKLRAGANAPYAASDAMTDNSCLPEEILLDENTEADRSQGGYYQLGASEASPSHRYLAVCEDLKGDEFYTLTVLDTSDPNRPPTRLSEQIPGCNGRVAWADDSTLFYVTQEPKTRRSYRIWRHKLGTPASEDVLVMEDNDETFSVGVERSRSGNFILLSSSATLTSEYKAIPTSRPTTQPQTLLPRKPGVKYEVDERAGRFYIKTDENAINSKVIVLTPGKTPNSVPIVTELFPHRESVKLEDISLFKNHLVLAERYDAVSHLRVYEFKSETSSELRPDSAVVPVDEECYTLWTAFSEFASPLLRYGYSSLTTPRSIYDIDMRGIKTQKPVLKKIQPVLGDFTPARYESRRLWATSPDGVKVPISVVYRKDKVNGAAPTVLEGYGAYEICNDPYFSSNLLSLLDRGVTFAIAHVRGGGEMGRPWYENGRTANKENTWRDFIACAQQLIADGVADPDRLCIEGGSAGGLLIGATLNTAPKRSDNKPFFAGALAIVPFVDCLTTMLDPSIPLTTVEYDEWGSPHEPEYYKLIKSYAPVDNVSPFNGPYPPIFIRAGLHDPRVGYWEPLKYAQVLRDAGAAHVLCQVDMSAGHFAQSGRFDRLKDKALEFAFLLRAMGLEDQKPASNNSKTE